MLSTSKFSEIHKAMSAIAQKVYAAVPCGEPWALSYIFSEMQRLGCSTRDVRIVQGCLNSLKESGLILEPKRGLFIRAVVKPEKPAPAIQIPTTKEHQVTPVPATPKTPRAPMAVLSDLATRLKALSDEFETAALEIDEYIAAKDVDAGKLKQLQTLLKSLS